MRRFNESGSWSSNRCTHRTQRDCFRSYSWEELDDYIRSSMYYHSTFQFDAQGRIIQELSYESPDSTSWDQDSKDTYL